MKKIIAAFLAVVITLLSACGQPPAPTTSPGETYPTTVTTTAEEYPTLIWYQVGSGQPENYDSWQRKVNAYLERKIGVHLDVRVIPWSDWANVRAVILQTGEPYDLIFTDMATYASDVRSGAFANLSRLIKKTPGLTEAIPEDYLNACMIDRKLYGIPCHKDSSMTNFFVWTKADVEAHFPGYAEAHTLADIDAGLRAIAKATGKAPLLLNRTGLSSIISSRYDACTLGSIGIGIAYQGGTEFVPVFEQPDVLADLTLLQTWMAEGLINSDAAIRPEAAGMCTLGIAQGWPSAADAWGESRGAEVVISQYGDTVVSGDTVLGAITCLNAESQHKEEAMALLELVNTDTTLRDMLWYGEEGYNFEYIQEDGVRKVQRINHEWTMAAYTQGNFFVSSPEVGSNGYVEVKAQNDRAIPSPAFGFIPDTTGIQDEIDAVRAVVEGYRHLILTGTGRQDHIDAMMVAMRQSGFDTILAEINAQYAAWLAEN